MKWIVRCRGLSIVQIVHDEIIIGDGPPHLFETENEANVMLGELHARLGRYWQVLAIN